MTGQVLMQPPEVGGSGGYAAVDAMVALLILTMTIVLALGAVQTARRAAVAAEEARRATLLVRYLADSAPVVVGAQTGQTGVFAWRVTVNSEKTTDVAPAPMCDRTAVAVSARSHRRYSVTGAAICPRSAAP